LALHYEARFLKTPGSTDRAHAGFANILARYGSVAGESKKSADAAAKKKPAAK
jgi:hypothetical protein